MRARTKLQQRVADLTQKLPQISDDQQAWAKIHCLPHIGNATKNRVLCLDCRAKFPAAAIKNGKATCPNCNMRLTIQPSASRTATASGYFAIATIVEEFQVIRYFRCYARYKDDKPADINCYAVFECWILPNGKVELIGLIHNNWGYSDSWSGKWEIRNKANLYKYDITPDRYWPSSRFKPEYRKIGINSSLAGMSFLDAVKYVPQDSCLETLLKAKQYGMLAHRHQVRQYWPSVKICLRNKYKPVDAGIWFDYLELLDRFRKDMRNAAYVCPKNLKAEHDRYVEKDNERRRQEEVQRKKERIERSETLYAERIKKYLGLQFTDGVITVKVLETVKEFYEEGNLLKHCVFTNDYYTRENCLIMSARIQGVPIETIEVSLSKMEIVQSRGLRNNPTEHNERIVALVQKNLNKIRQISRQKSA